MLKAAVDDPWTPADCTRCERLYENGEMVGDGDTRRCPDCGTVWMVSMDAETEPYLVRRDDDDSSRKARP